MDEVRRVISDISAGARCTEFGKRVLKLADHALTYTQSIQDVLQKCIEKGYTAHNFVSYLVLIVHKTWFSDVHDTALFASQDVRRVWELHLFFPTSYASMFSKINGCVVNISLDYKMDEARYRLTRTLFLYTYGTAEFCFDTRFSIPQFPVMPQAQQVAPTPPEAPVAEAPVSVPAVALPKAEVSPKLVLTRVDKLAVRTSGTHRVQFFKKPKQILVVYNKLLFRVDASMANDMQKLYSQVAAHFGLEVPFSMRNCGSLLKRYVPYKFPLGQQYATFQVDTNAPGEYTPVVSPPAVAESVVDVPPN